MEPFPFKYRQKTNLDAMREFLDESESFWYYKFDRGEFSNFVLCFSEVRDRLGQWRGYGDDGRGLCIGFSKKALEEYCSRLNGVLRMEKVIYISDSEAEEILNKTATSILAELKGLRQWIIDNMTTGDDDPDTDGLLGFNFDSMLASAFSDSLCYKTQSFREEREWRIFLSDQAYKEPKWVYKKGKEFIGPNGFDETLNFLNDKIDFRYTENDLIPFCPLRFKEFTQNPIIEIWVGPKNNCRASDFKLFLEKNGYDKVHFCQSQITYR